MRTFNKIVSTGLIFLAANMGCQEIPCYPPGHYAPEPNAPYTAEEVRVATPKGHTLAGTLTIPSDTDPPYPGVLLITGSSPQDRDHAGTSRKPVSDYKPFRQLADALSGNGMAVLRMDDQGVGCSEGGPLENVTIRERAADSRAGVAYLRQRREIDKDRIGLLGLSEGGNIGPLIAASAPSIRAVVVMAGSATNGYKIIEYQRRLKISERPALPDQEKERELDQSMQGLKRAIRRGAGNPWFRSFLAYMPLTAAQNVSCPVLILHGDRDAHVPVDHARLLARAIRANGNQAVTVRIFKNHNHLFLKDADGRMSGYRDLLTHTHKLPAEVLRIITDWLSIHLARESRWR